MRKIFLSIAFILTLALGSYSDLRYQWQKAWHNYKQAQKLSETHQAFNQKTIDDIKNNYAKISASLQKNSQASIIQAGQNLGLQITAVNSRAPAKKDFLVEQQVQLSITGTYQQFLDFLKLINSKNYFITIDNFTMTRQLPAATTVLSNQNTPDTLAITANAIFYYLP